MRCLEIEALESKDLLTAYLVEDINNSPKLFNYATAEVGDELYLLTNALDSANEKSQPTLFRIEDETSEPIFKWDSASFWSQPEAVRANLVFGK